MMTCVAGHACFSPAGGRRVVLSCSLGSATLKSCALWQHINSWTWEKADWGEGGHNRAAAALTGSENNDVCVHDFLYTKVWENITNCNPNPNSIPHITDLLKEVSWIQWAPDPPQPNPPQNPFSPFTLILCHLSFSLVVLFLAFKQLVS